MPDLPAIMAEIYYKLGQGGKGISLLEEFIQNAEASYFRTQSVHVLLDLYINEDRKDRIEALIEPNFQSDAILDKVSLCRANRYLGHAELAKSIILEGYNLVNENSTYKELFFLGEELARQKYYDQAIAVYQRIAVSGLDSEPNVKLYRLYHLVGKVDKALAILKDIRVVNGPSRQSTGFEVELCQELGDYNHAIEIAEEFLASFPTDASMRLILSGLYLREGRATDAEHILLDGAGFDKLSINSISSYIAQLNELGRKDLVYPFIYDFSRLNDDKASIELYLQTFLQFPQDATSQLKPDIVSIDSAVSIKNDLGDKFTIILEDRPINELKSNEVAPGQKHFDRLFGCKIGEVISIDSFRSWTVENIDTKYQFRFKENKKKIDTLYSDSSRLQTHRVENMQEVLGELVAQNGGYFRDYQLHLKACHDGRIPLGLIAERFDKNPIDVYLEMRAMNYSLLSSSGTTQNDSQRYGELLSGKILCADLTALLHLYQLNIAEELVSTFGKILISNSTYDLIFDAVSTSRNFRADNKPGPFYQGLLEFTKKVATAVFPENLLTVNALERQTKEQFVGKSFLDSIYLCDQKQAVLLSDDLFFSKSIAYSAKIQSIWTQGLLFYLSNIGVLSVENYFQKCVLLSTLRYRHCSVNAKIIFTAFKGFHGMPSNGFEACCYILHGNQSTLHSAADVVYHFGKLLLADKMISLREKQETCFLLINSLMIDRVVIEVINELRHRFLAKDSVLSSMAERATVALIRVALDRVIDSFISRP